MVVFEEIPDEITLSINITNCPCHCPDCHSKFLWEDVGTELTKDELNRLIKSNDGITCVCFMGGDANPKEINELAEAINANDTYGHKPLKIAWYSGKDELSKDINVGVFNYIKLGRYDKNFGPLNKETTNQRLYEVFMREEGEFELKNITNKFWKSHEKIKNK